MPQQDFLADVWEQEEAIAECMRERGFEYVPWLDPNADAAFGSTVTAQTPDNPNDEIIAGLSEEEQEAYAEAYWGGERATTDPRNEGCVAVGTRETFGELPNFEELDRELPRIDAAVESDPRVVEAHTEWQTCMRDRGFSVADRLAMLDDMSLLLERYMADPDIVTEWGDEASFYTYEESLFEADEDCAADLLLVQSTVRDELLDEFWAGESAP